MNYIVLDLEWNQALYGKKMIKSPVLLHGEIIQIGAVKLDENFNVLKTFKIMVSPKYYTKMHKKVMKLTNITEDDLKFGFPFPFALKHFKKWCGEDFAFLTWGNDDLGILKDNIILHALTDEWLPQTYDLQLIFGYHIGDCRKQVSLSNAIELVQEEAFDAHDALNDAQSTAKICKHLDMEQYLMKYDEIVEERNLSNPAIQDLDAFVKEYENKLEALNDIELIQFACPICQEKVLCEGLVKQNSDKYIGLGTCKDGNQFFVRFKFKKVGKKHLRIIRVVHELNEENKNFYLKKKESYDRAMEFFRQSQKLACCS